MAEIGSAFLSILPSAKGFGSKLETQVSSETKGSGKKIGGILGGAVKVGAVAAIGSAAVAAGFLKGAIGDAREAQKVTAATNAIIKATGGAANVSAAGVAHLAGTLAAKTGVDDGQIQAGENLLLTFKNVKSAGEGVDDVFARATKAGLDLAAAGFGSVEGNAIQLGKALNDPTKGIAALAKSGVTFTEGQKEQIKGFAASNDLLSAQKIILGEVEAQVGGTAEATATSGEKAAYAFGELKESIGTALLPVVDKLATVFTEKIAPAIAGFVGGMQDGTGAGGSFADILRGLYDKAIKPIGAFLFDTIVPAIGAFIGGMKDGTGLGGKFRDFLTGLADTLRPIGEFIVGTVVPAIVDFVKGMNDGTGAGGKYVDILTRVYGAIKTAADFFVSDVLPVLKDFAVYIKTDVVPVVVDLARKIAEKMQPIIKQLGETFRNDIAPAIEKLVAKFREWQPTIQAVIGVIIKIVAKLVEFVASVLSVVIPALIRFVGYIIRKVVPAVIGIIDGLKSFIGFVRNTVIPVVLRIASTFLKMAQFGIDAFRFLLDAALGAFEGILNAADKGLGWVPGLGDKIKGAKKAFSEFRDSTGKMLDDLSAKVGKSSDALDKLAKPRSTTITTTFVSKYVKIKAGRDQDIAGPDGLGKALVDPIEKLGKTTGKGFLDGLADGMKKATPRLTERLKKLADSLRSQLSGLRGDLASLASSIAESFRPDLFSGNLGNFFTTGQQGKSNLQSIAAAFKKLRGFGLGEKFLSDLYASGNSALILDLASGDKATARSAQSLYDQTNRLANGLGKSVAQNEFGDDINRLANRLEKVLKRLPKETGREVGREINGAATRGRRDARV